MESTSEKHEPAFDRELRFNEVFGTPEFKEFMAWLTELTGVDMVLAGPAGEIQSWPEDSNALSGLPRPNGAGLPREPTRYRDDSGRSSVGLPVSHEGDTFALILVEEDAASDPASGRKLKLAANTMEWYIHLVHQRRMITELHQDAQAMSYEELLREHEKVVRSEKKYRELSETLEQRVEERKRELENTQHQLLQQEKMASIGQLAAGVAHEINNPTGYLRSNLQTLTKYHEQMVEVLKKAKDAGIAENEWEEYDLDYVLEDLPVLMEQSLNGTDRIIKIVKGLSRFSHVEEENLETVNMNELLDQTIELLWNEIKHKAELKKEYGDLPPIQANASQLSQVFVNFIVNALHAMEKGGDLTIRTIAREDGVAVEISDTGKGIPEEALSRIFDPFFTTKPVGEGTGLGLSISYEIIKGHGGEIEVESEPWKGTTFTVVLPVSSEKEGE